jgi:predicted nucleic acid-binding Zn ribbon protein
MKHCKVCNNEFQERSQGTEQLYCSTTCRALASKKRQEQKIINNAIQEKKTSQENQIGQSSPIVGRGIQKEQSSEVLYGNEQQNHSPISYGSPISSNIGKNYLHEYYEQRISNNALVLRNQYLEDKIKELEKEIFDLNNEIDVLENPKEDENDMLGSITSQFIKNPLETAKFVTTMFETLNSKK